MKRLASLDALRGFDMLWIMGGQQLLCAIVALFGIEGFAQLMDHVRWDGLHFMDTVFPTFLFLAGASFPFSSAKSFERGLTRGRIALRALRRGLILMALGIVYWGFLRTMDFKTFRIPSVLGYIGFGWMVAAWIYLYVRSIWKRIAIAVGILALVTLFFGFVPAPDAPVGASIFSPEGHFGCWLDRTILGRHSLTPRFDNEGFGGLLPTIVTAMLGMFAGEIVKGSYEGEATKATGLKALKLLVAGIVSSALGLALSCFYPIVKNLWSPSFVLVVGGYSFAVFALFFWLIDVKGWTRWSFFFRVIGMNSITIYLAQEFIHFGDVQDFFLRGFEEMLPSGLQQAAYWLGYVIACWLFLYFLHRKNVFLKV